MIKKITAFRNKWKDYKQHLKQRNKIIFFIVDGLEILLVALFFALLIRHYILQTSLIPSESMYPTMQVGDRLFVNKFLYRFRDPQRGEIVVFRSVDNDGKDIVKRCIGIGGDVVTLERGRAYVNGEPLFLPGVVVHRDFATFGPYSVPEGHFFMLGDNRAYSKDSRYWGTVPRENVLGTAWFNFWPLKRMKVIK